tara:strand:- start:1284 stop:1949 length:666 start_codon:yes stop_codon:yes gene_type:complete
MSKTNAPAKAIEVLKEIGLSQNEAMWNCHGTWVMYHRSCERIAAHKKISFDMPKILEQDLDKKSVIMLVTGKLGTISEWSIGEATPANNKNAYPYAMAEKRAKDRVILKLIGLHGDIYSSSEIDKEAQEQIKREAAEKAARSFGTELIEPEDKPKEEPKDPWVEYINSAKKEISEHTTQAGLTAWANQNEEALKKLKKASKVEYDRLFQQWVNRKKEFKNA